MTTLTVSVAASADDAYDYDLTYSDTDAHMCMGDAFGGSSNASNGFRFLNVTIPAGSTINSAFWDGYNNYGGGYATHVKTLFYCEAADNPATFSLISRPSGRTKTTANVAWDSNSGSTPDNTYFSATGTPPPDIKTCIQEVVDRGGWASGNALVVLNIGNGSDTDWQFYPYSYDGDSTHPPKLTIIYTAPSGVVVGSGLLDGLRMDRLKLVG